MTTNNTNGNTRIEESSQLQTLRARVAELEALLQLVAPADGHKTPYNEFIV